MDDQPTQVSQNTRPLGTPEERKRVHGCFTALVVVIPFLVVMIAGFAWVSTVFPPFTPGPILTIDLGRMGGYAALLAIIGLPVLLFLKKPRFTLWRGLGLTFVVAAGHAFLGGGILAIDRGVLEYPGFPYLVPSILTIIYVAVVMYLLRDRYFGDGFKVPVALLGLALGLLLSWGWIYVGVLGTPFETLMSIIEALSYALLGSLFVTLPFTFDQDFPKDNPFWTAAIAGAALMGMFPAVMATRGFQLQGVYVAAGIVAAGLAAGSLLTLDESPSTRRLWPAVTTFLFGALVVPFIWSEGLEGDWMLTELGQIWSQALLIVAITAVVLDVLLLALHGVIAPRIGSPIVPAVLAVLFLVGVPAVYVLTGNPGFTPDTFFVVMEDQADTSFARDIEDRDERVTAVYEALVKQAEEDQEDLRAFLDERNIEYTPYYLVNGMEVNGGRLLRLQIARQPGVARILESPQTRPIQDDETKPLDISAAIDSLSEAGSEPLSSASYVTNSDSGLITWGLADMKVDRVWEELEVNGEGIIVGNADSGVDWTHPDLRDNYLGRDGNIDYTWFDPWEGTTEPTDDGGHGTHTAGTSFGADGIGVAPGAQWIACRNLARNLGNPAFYLDCMQFLFAPFPLDGDPFEDGDPTRGAHVTNNSWGCPPEEGCDGETMGIGIEHLRDAGQMMVISAGNDGPVCESIGIPATNDDGFSVGAVGPGGSIEGFSSRGPAIDYDGDILVKPDVAAPGFGVYSAAVGGGYVISQGTSMAGPHVAGLVALVWSANPDLIGDIDQTEFIITRTAEFRETEIVCGGETDQQNNVYGYGFVNAYEAVRQAQEVR